MPPEVLGMLPFNREFYSQDQETLEGNNMTYHNVSRFLWLWGNTTVPDPPAAASAARGASRG